MQAGPVLRGEIEALTPETGAEVECGDVVLRPAPLAVRGHVLDDRGAPVRDVWLSAGRKLLIHNPGEDFRWEFGVDLPGVYTDQDGLFEIRGVVEPGEYALWPGKPGYTSLGWTPFEIGAQDVEIVLARESVIAGKVLADPGFPLERLSVVIEDASHDTVREWFVDSRSQVQSSGAFRVEGLRPGKVRLLVQSGRYSGAHWVVNELELDAGECTDPDARTIDLRGRVHAHEVEVVDDAGQPVRTGCVIVRPGDAGEEARVYILEEGRAAWIAGPRVVDVHVRSPGFRDASALGVTSSRRITLERGIPVTLRMPPDLELPQAPWFLEVGLHPPANDEDRNRREYTRDSAEEMYWNERRVDAFAPIRFEREVTLHVPLAERYELSWTLYDPGDASRGAHSMPVWSKTPAIEIGPSATTFEVRPDPEDYERVLGTVR